jgi:dTDP-4-dehydrorhamnose reductase
LKLVVLGANGQLGWELARSLVPLGDVVALGRSQLDLAELETIAPTLRALRPDVIVNAAAYTAVDAAETDEAVASRINGEAVGILAEVSAATGALLVHYSTDYVFDGSKETPYVESDPVAPLNAYGRSKLLGEQAIRNSSADWLVVRTTWVYAARGSNFMRTMMRLAGERDVLRVVSDQRGAPTDARFLADATAHVLRSAVAERKKNSTFESGLYHLSAAGETTWHGFASLIVNNLRNGPSAPMVKTTRLDAIASTDYPTPARRPENSMLDNGRFVDRFGLHRPDWKDGLAATLQEAMRA